jgi:beta-glucosidase
MLSKLAVAVALGVFFCAGSPAQGAGDLAANCKEAKAKTAGKKAFDLLKAFGKNGKKPNHAKLAGDVSKAQSKFTKGFSKAESSGACRTTADTEAMEAKVDAFVDDVLLSQKILEFGFCDASFEGVEERIDALLPQMTLEEKVEQMTGFGRVNKVWTTADNERLGIPGFGMLDGPRGASAGAGNATCFPVGMARGATWDPGLEERVGEAIGAEVRARGASVLLAPTINLLRHPRWGRSQETYGEDPLHLGKMGVGFIRGAQEHVIASPKHFALNSIEDTRFDANVTVDERTLREIYLPHFRAAVQEGHAGSVMSAYNKVNGFYCDQNFNLLRDILKGDWGFPGFVESDWFGTRSTAPSAIAGLDIEMPMNFFYGEDLVAAVQAEEVPEETIDEAVRRILRTKFCFRLDVDPPVPNPDIIETQEHTDLALEVERNAIVLLKNEGSALPLERSGLVSIVVVGALANTENLGDTGSSNVKPSYVITPLEGIQDRAGAVTVTYVAGDPLTPADETTIAAANAAIVVAGLTKLDEGEGLVGAGDRDGLDLSSEKEQLISDVAGLNGRTIVVLEGGGSIVMENWVDQVEGILMAWYPGQEGGHAIADVLFGDTNPSGKLPITFPASEDQLPEFDNTSLEVTYDYYHGYRYLDRNLTDPRFPFGHGLSYTTYAYSNLTISDTTLAPDGTLQVGFDVTNAGSVAGKEIAQLYVSYLGSSVDRPVRDLKGFAKVELDPAETKRVTLELEAEDLAYYDVGAGRWVVEPISYVVQIGPSSRDLPLGASFQIE